MSSVLSPIPFAIWVVDIVGILPTSTKQAKYCIIAVDYMTMWVEARPLSAITEEVVKTFMLEPNFSSVTHAQRNSAVEAANKIIFQGIKKKLGEAKGKWAEKLPWILWAYRTTPRSYTGETPSRMAYGTNAFVHVEVGMDFYRNEVYNVENNEFGRKANIDLLDEESEATHQRNLKYLLQAAQYYDSGVKKKSFGVGDLVLRELSVSMPTKQGKFNPNWEGPYKVTEVVHPETYKVETLVGETIKNTWHASRLRKFYQ
ncbi:uncharacterized protein LOC141715093 [Apium graveolens]|uniref:uncharacterized protein LOC141715093 n=1 Tax=Apium graveolens TaxID=4045 RepID=UPI003D79C239